MKNHLRTIISISALAVLTCAANSARADVTNLVSISATVLSQGTTNLAGGIATIAAPKSSAINTKQILTWLALDEYAESNYVATNFPTGSQLVLITGTNSEDFQVLDKSNHFVVDVSDILNAYPGSNYVYSGKVKVSTGVYSPSITSLKIGTFGFDDSGVTAVSNRSPVGVTFFLRGLETKVTIDTVPNTLSNYTESVSAQVSNGLGEGTYKGKPILVTGSFGYSVVLKRHL